MEKLRNIPMTKESEELTEEDFEEMELNEKEEMFGEEMANDEENQLGLKSKEEQEEIGQEEIGQEQVPTVYKLSENENGKYEKDGKRYDLLSCHICESKETYETGEYTAIPDEEGNVILLPVTATRVVINKGWQEFESEQKAIEGFGITKIQEEDNGNID